MSYIRTLLPRFSSARYDDAVAIARIIRAVASAPKRIARFGIIDYDSDSILSIVRAYYQYLTLNHHLTNEDEIVLHNARCLTRLCNSSSDVDIESYINKLYRLFLYVSKFLRNWHLPPIGGNLDPYTNRIMFILKTGIEYEKKADYVRMCDSLRIQQDLPAPMLFDFDMVKDFLLIQQIQKVLLQSTILRGYLIRHKYLFPDLLMLQHAKFLCS